MSKVGVSLKIDVTKIDKARLFEGKKGKYLDATVFIDLAFADEYGNNGMITQDVSKEEKERGDRGPILGNAKVFWQGEGKQQQPRPVAPSVSGPAGGFDDDPEDLPF
jgi:hypothetical protein